MPGASATVLIAFDRSEAAAVAIRAAVTLLPRARAVVLTAHTVSAISQEASAAAPDRMPEDILADRFANFRQAVEADAVAAADAGAALARRAGLAAEAETSEGTSVSAAIRAAAGRLNADLIVCGNRGRGGFSRAILGSTSSSLVYHADRPVLVVPEGAGDLSGPILVGYDGSEGARAAVAVAARLFGGRAVIVAKVWESPIRHSLTGKALQSAPISDVRDLTADLDEYLADAAHETAEQGAALAREHGVAAQSQAIEARSAPWRGLVAAAHSSDAAVIVAGSRGQGGVASTVLGSVSAGLAHNADLPVLIVRE